MTHYISNITSSIIGILSSIALPQYKVVAEKARVSEALVVGKAIADAEQRYIQANPDEEKVCHWSDIADVDLKGGSWHVGGGVGSCDSFETDRFLYKLGDGSFSVKMYRKGVNNNISPYVYLVSINRADGSKTCTCGDGSSGTEAIIQEDDDGQRSEDPGQGGAQINPGSCTESRISQAICAFIELM